MCVARTVKLSFPIPGLTDDVAVTAFLVRLFTATLLLEDSPTTLLNEKPSSPNSLYAFDTSTTFLFC